VVALAIALLLVQSGCAGPTIGDHIPKAQPPTAAPPVISTPEASPTPERPAETSFGSAPDDLRTVDWRVARLPGDFCAVDGIVTFQDGRTRATSTTWGEIDVDVLPDQNAYGDVDGDGHDDAAVAVDCDAGGDTGSSVIGYGFVVVAGHDGALDSLGAIVPQLQPEDAYASTRLSVTEMGDMRVVVEEQWYRHEDATCCPTGRATTEWTYRDGRLQAGRPVVTR
jgi:LppP/LprE lipoprotein